MPTHQSEIMIYKDHSICYWTKDLCDECQISPAFESQILNTSILPLCFNECSWTRPIFMHSIPSTEDKVCDSVVHMLRFSVCEVCNVEHNHNMTSGTNKHLLQGLMQMKNYCKKFCGSSSHFAVKIMGQPPWKSYKLNFHWEIHGDYFQDHPLLWAPHISRVPLSAVGLPDKCLLIWYLTVIWALCQSLVLS